MQPPRRSPADDDRPEVGGGVPVNPGASISVGEGGADRRPDCSLKSITPNRPAAACGQGQCPYKEATPDHP